MHKCIMTMEAPWKELEKSNTLSYAKHPEQICLTFLITLMEQSFWSSLVSDVTESLNY